MAQQKKIILQKSYIAQKWLTDLQISIILLLKYSHQNLILEYQKFIDEPYDNWQLKKPTLWLGI